MPTIKPLGWMLMTLASGFAIGMAVQGGRLGAQADSRVFELRTYTTPEGKLADLQARFRNHTTQLFEKHGITNIGYWVPQDAPLSENTLIYIIAYPNREEAKKRWGAFASDPEWQKARTASELQGRLTAKVESVFMSPADFSPMK
ncbi:MAG: NIPSNAP family protein [Luteitalea sp.]|nr:NIPSNAP family protein [Luteitalea sp.]